MILLPPQMYREFHLSIVIAKKMRMQMKTRVPRNLFGSPERKDSAQLLQETLDQERARFQKRWSVDPLSEDDDKENGPHDCNSQVTPKKRSSPYAKQTSIHNYWRSRKFYESSIKSPSATCTDTTTIPVLEQSPPQMQSLSLSPIPTPLQQQQQQQQQQQTLPLQELASAPQQAQSTQEAQPAVLKPLDNQQADKQLDDLQP